MNLQLGEEQEKALSMVKDFIKGRPSPACLYYGSAGTGKSLLVNYIIEYLESNNISYCLCAPTHKAALVLSRFTNRDACTLHKLLSLSPKLDIFALDFRNLMFQSKGYAAEMPYKGVVICDESSMINDDLYDCLITKAAEFSNIVVFTGDFKQIQPVKQESLSKIINTQPSIELTKIYRQSDENGLIPSLQALRTHSINHFESSIGMDGSLLVTSNMGEFLKTARDQFQSAMKKSDILGTKILCYTNDRVAAYNNAIHKLLFGTDCEYHKGEFLIGCENFEFNKFKFYNSMDYIVINEPDKIQIPIPYFGTLPGWRLELYDSLFKMSSHIAILSKDISRDYLDGLSIKIEETRQNAVSWSAVNKAKARFYWKRYYEMINSFASPIDMYYDGRLIRKKSFDYSYAITTHKSQGSSLDNVLVDMRNINSCSDENVRRQLQYVALSRTRKDALIYQ
jgi:hypothetical protein